MSDVSFRWNVDPSTLAGFLACNQEALRKVAEDEVAIAATSLVIGRDIHDEARSMAQSTGLTVTEAARAILSQQMYARELRESETQS